MYAGVPRIDPESDRSPSPLEPLGQAEVGHVRPALASSRMFDGFRSRCRMPRWCAWCTARATVATSRAAAAGSARSPASRSARLGAVDQLHAEVVPAVVLADLVDRHDLRVVQVGDRLGLVAEPADFVVARPRARRGSS